MVSIEIRPQRMLKNVTCLEVGHHHVWLMGFDQVLGSVRPHLNDLTHILDKPFEILVWRDILDGLHRKHVVIGNRREQIIPLGREDSVPAFKHNFYAPTKSPKGHIRAFHFNLAELFYDIWAVVNLELRASTGSPNGDP